ncbi:hypothetical protein BCR42DRAFT_455148 [Absidia repens]|uniref:HMG box domain-containing protein n=1 Tax=Absidia repens TaxID=90262 RepID=A0A1X2I4H8_9FUNG|nr:hypothetical protein BCR42DRAFT_455148 [Absidia repens]
MSTENVDTTSINKYEQLRKRVQEMEQDKSDIHSKLLKAQNHVKRLRMERLILLEQLDEYYTSQKGHIDTSDSDGSGGSGAESYIYEGRLKQLKRKRGRHNDKSIASNKKSSSSKLLESQTATPARKKKDPNAPKGPGNVFFLYCRMEREHFKDELPTENLGEVTRLLGQKWKAMTDDEKKKYYDIYDREQEEYQRAMKSYKEAGGGDAGRTAVSEMSNTIIKTDNVDYGDVDIIQDELDVNIGDDNDEDDDDDGDIGDDEGSGLFMDEVETITNVPALIGSDVSNNTPSLTDATHSWYGN